MAYATLAQFKERLGNDLYAQLTDLSGSTTASDTVGQARLDDAHAFVNAKIAVRYLTPVDVTVSTALAEMMVAITCAVAAYGCLGMHPDTMNQLREGVDAVHKHWMALLDQIAAGKAALPGAAVIPAAVSSGPSSAVFGDDRVFTRESMKGF